nr:tetraspanin-36-like isoform X2 [Pelodiscus sinensis]|eukprot:XP_006136795.1 tetraspanin-36-like isoform X2 [Pelodiscus sinensis]
MDCGVITSKTVLLLLSLIFWGAAAGLGYVGGYVISTYKNYDSFVQDKYTMLPAVIIICVALVMFIIGLIGCCATLRESRVGLGLVKTDVQGTMRTVFQKYDGKSSESGVVDYLQEQLQCCGVTNYTDWITTQWFNTTGNNSVPLSCCKQDIKNCTGDLKEPQVLNAQGCAGKVEDGLQNVLTYAMLVILGFAIIKFFGMLSVCVITCKREDNGYQPLYTGVFA